MAGYGQPGYATTQNQGYGDDIGHGYHKSSLKKDEVRSLPQNNFVIYGVWVFFSSLFMFSNFCPLDFTQENLCWITEICNEAYAKNGFKIGPPLTKLQLLEVHVCCFLN